MKKIIKFILAVVAALLFVGLFAVPAGDLLSGSFLFWKGINCIALAIVGEIYTILERREARHV